MGFDERAAGSPADSFLARIQRDTDAINGEQSACYLHLNVSFPAAVDSGGRDTIAEALPQRIREHLPDAACIAPVGPADYGVWLPKSTIKDALTLARLLRLSLTTRTLPSTERQCPGESTAPPSCALGIVVVRQSNWSADTLIRTAQLTAATARLAGSTGGIRIADQVVPPISER